MEITIIPYSNDNYAYLLSCSKTGETALVDAGEKKPILDALQKKNVDLKKILCTHHHFDHIAAVSDIKNHYSDAEVLASQNAKGKISEAKHFLKEGEFFQWVRLALKCWNLLDILKAVLVITPNKKTFVVWQQAEMFFCFSLSASYLATNF